jgi:hypothetical protein
MWSRFLSLFRNPAAGPEPGSDPDPEVARHADPDVERLRHALREQRWDHVAAGVEQWADPLDRNQVIEGLADWPGRPRFFDDWVAAEPKRALAHLLRGAHGVVWAWEARTGAQAKHVHEDAWPVFFKRLKGARKDLEQAIKLDAQEGAGFGPLLRVARGLQLGEEQARTWLEAARKRNPHDFQAHYQMVLFLCKKWNGTHKKMFAFARQTAEELMEHNLLHALIVSAHYERWLYAGAFERDAAVAEGYWQRPAVQQEIVQAYHRSLGAPRFQETKTAAGVRKTFVGALVLTNETELARRECGKLNGPLSREEADKWGPHGRTILDFCNRYIG